MKKSQNLFPSVKRKRNKRKKKYEETRFSSTSKENKNSAETSNKTKERLKRKKMKKKKTKEVCFSFFFLQKGQVNDALKLFEHLCGSPTQSLSNLIQKKNNALFPSVLKMTEIQIG